MDGRQAFGQATVLYGARDPGGRLYTQEFETWKKHDTVFRETVDQAHNNWKGHVGVVTLLLERLQVPRPNDTQVLICGPEVMMHYTALGALEKQIPPENIWVSLERNMNLRRWLLWPLSVGTGVPVQGWPGLEV